VIVLHLIDNLLTALTDDRSAVFLPLFFTYPELMECTQTRKDTPTEPPSVASLSWVTGGMYFRMIEYPVQFIVQPVRKARKQASPSAEHYVAQQNLANVGVTRGYGSADKLREGFR